MFKRILVPLDGSTLAEQALPAAARLARATGGSVLLVRIVNPLPEFGLYTAETAPYLRDILDERLTQATMYLAQVAAAKPLDGVKTRIAVFSGAIAPYILDVVHDEQIDLIVISSHGYSGFKRWTLGSIAQKVIHHSPVPVLLLRQHGQMLSGLSPLVPHPVRALVALDGSSFAETALRPAVELVTALSAPVRGEIQLTQLVKPPTVEEELTYEHLDIDVDIRQATLYKSGEYLHNVRERLLQEMPDTDINITWSVEEGYDTAETLIKLAERGEGIASQQPCDLIVMATHGRGGLQRWLLGSITERVLEHSSLPALIVRSKEPVAKEPEPNQEEEALLQGIGFD